MTQFAALLDTFRQVPSPPERLPTLMEITGYPHYENVCNNLLAFFFDPSNPHGLGTLFLDALARAAGIENGEGTMSGGVEVEREAATEAGNSIDILIRSDSHAILIENKIFASIANPFADYAAHLDSLAEHRDKHKFVLTLKPVGESVERIGHGFRNITHEQLVNEIRGLLGCYVAGADTRYLTFMLDFLNTLDNLQGGMVMNPEFVEFLASKQDEANDFFLKINSFREELRSKLRGLRTLIDVTSYSNVQQGWWRPQDRPLVDYLVHTIRNNTTQDFVIGIDTIIAPNGWEIQIYPRGNAPDGRERLRVLLQTLEIPFEEEKEGVRFVSTRFLYSADLNEIAQSVKKVVYKLALGNDA